MKRKPQWPGWKKGVFTFATEDGPRTAIGFIAGPFAIDQRHKDVDGRRISSRWVLTHLPTGGLMAEMRTGTGIRALAKELFKLTDWSTVNFQWPAQNPDAVLRARAIKEKHQSAESRAARSA